ncbi:MAG: hypothetical protein KGJ07_02820 [Patescibacteria group bacterium]|nr:hypothetical protein [Patescibacteria group bacterium]MDE2590312.1 hypothetical protein [Patescibacteria group bacterium]
MRKQVIIFAIMLVIGGVGVWIYLNSQTSGSPISQEEKIKALTKLLGRTPILDEKKTSTAWISHENSYVSFLYPEVAKVYAQDNQIAMQQNEVLDSFHFGLDTPKLYVTVQVLSRLQESNLSDEPSVLMRQQQQSGYLQSVMSLDSYTARVFAKEAQDTTEKSVFLLTNGRVYSIVVTGGNMDDVSTFFDKFTASFQIRP